MPVTVKALNVNLCLEFGRDVLSFLAMTVRKLLFLFEQAQKWHSTFPNLKTHNSNNSRGVIFSQLEPCCCPPCSKASFGDSDWNLTPVNTVNRIIYKGYKVKVCSKRKNPCLFPGQLTLQPKQILCSFALHILLLFTAQWWQFMPIQVKNLQGTASN